MRQYGRQLWQVAVVAGVLLAGTASASSGPSVASLNVCTDQLAMLLAEPGQIRSVSVLARDPASSPLHELANQYPVNSGLAEQVLVQKPDLVVTGTFSLHNTTQLLRRLDFRVEEFAYVQSVATVPGDIRRMGRLLGQVDRAERLASRFENDLAGFGPLACSRKPVAIAYGHRGIALGKGTLADSAMTAAGFANMASDMGYEGIAAFPLELLVQNPPDLIILPKPTPGAPALADEILSHPALRQMPDTVIRSFSNPALLSCGAPSTLEAMRELRAFAPELTVCKQGIPQ